MTARRSAGTLRHAIRDWFRHWWSRDRVRISPTEGLLWRLQPGGLLEVEGEMITVISRRWAEGNFVGLEFTCRSADTVGLLQVRSISKHPYSQVFWTTADGSRELDITEIRVWESRSHLQRHRETGRG